MFEALFSAALFAEDDARGLLGGAITAIGLSGANVTLGFLAGFLGLRYLQHVQAADQSGGRAGVRGAGGAGADAQPVRRRLARSARGAGRPPGRSRLGRELPSLVAAAAQSPQAIILLMLGAGVWVFAALKGYSGFDDPYPDYGKMDRAAREAGDALSDFRADARLELEAPVNAARAALAARMEKMRAEFEAMSKAFDAAAAQDGNARRQGARARRSRRRRGASLSPGKRRAPHRAGAGLFRRAAAGGRPRARCARGRAAMIDDARARLAEAQAQSARALEELARRTRRRHRAARRRRAA